MHSFFHTYATNGFGRKNLRRSTSDDSNVEWGLMWAKGS